jgi:hypothetical protein
VDDPAIVTSVQIALADREEAFVRMAASGAIPRNAALSGGDFSGRLARLSGCVSCDLGDAKLPKVAFDGGFFSETSFAGAILDGATFIAATLEGVDFSGVDLSGVDFTGAKFSQVRVDSATTIREGQLTPEQKKGLVGAPKTVPAIALPAAEANPTDQVLTKGLTKGWDVDVFWCDTASREQNYAGASTIAIRLGTRAASGASLAPGIVLGRIRLRMWDKGRQAQTGVTQGRLVVYDKGRGEAETARVLQPIVQERSAPFQVALSTRAPTPTYISVFVCGAR